MWTNITTRLLYVSDLYQTGLDVEMKDVRLIDEHASTRFYDIQKNHGMLTFVNIKDVKLSGTSKEKCQFKNVVGPIFLIQSSNLILTGEMLFANTVASKWAIGAAIMLQANSMLWFYEPLHATFSNNSAITGGAIGSVQLVSEFCVMQYHTDYVYSIDNIASMNITIEFSNNSAHLAGNSIYMERLYTCSNQITPRIRVSDVSMVYDSTFKFTNKVNNGLSEMSSNPDRACICNGDVTNTSRAALSCWNAHKTSPISVFPGQTFSVNAIVVDEIYNPVFSTVYNTLLQNDDSQFIKNYDWKLGYGNDVVLLRGRNCTHLYFTILLSGDKNPQGILAIFPSQQHHKVYVSVSLKDCPLGFNLSSGACNCNSFLESKNFKCLINNGTIVKTDLTSWIGSVPNSSNDSKVHLAYAPQCSIEYCEQQYVVNVSKIDSACRFNRSGVMCGQCTKNLSTVIGHPMCSECSNLWLLTIPLYAAMGLICVVLLFLLRLTVSTGTITGVIFYANIININDFFFLGYESTSWLRIFISMLNLELGFPMCFYNGMTAIEAAYLSFTVPIYLGVILFAIVCLSRRFQFISNIISHSAVPVMATLIHLSFSKLLRLVVDAMVFTDLIVELDNGTTTRSVWLFDGDIEFLSRQHSLLFAFAIITLLIFLIPYTVFLSGINFFLRYRLTNQNRFKPFVDAYCAPYKDKYRFWFGLRLWVLIFAYMGYAALLNQPYFLVLIITSLFACFTIIQAVIMPYKSLVLNCLELFFLCNIIILHTVGLYSTNTNGIQISFDIQLSVNIIVGCAFIIFLGIITYHTYIYVVLWCVHHFSTKNREVILEKPEISPESCPEKKYSEAGSSIEKSNLSGNLSVVTYSSVLMNPHQHNPYSPSELREPLLEDDSDIN